MIVTCDECSTSFQLDESRIPASGARVRCSRCKHAFFLSNPSASATDAAHSIAEEAAQDETAGLPTASTDLAGLDGSIAAEAHPPEPERDPDPEKEDEWQFTEKIRTEGDDELDTEENFGTETDFSEGFDDVSLSDGLPEGEAESELELAGDSHGDMSSLEIADPAAMNGDSALDLEGDVDVTQTESGIEAGQDDSSFGDVKDFSALTEDAELDAAPLESVLDTELDDDSDAGLYASTGATEDLGDPASWDLAPDADFDSPRSSVAGLVGAFSSGSASAETSNFAGASAFEGGLDPADFDAQLVDRSKLGAGLRTIANGLGWLCTIVVVSVVAYLSLAPEWQRWIVDRQSLAVDAFSAETTDSRWFDTTRLGPLLIVDGIVRNTGSGVVWPASTQVILLDEAGEEIVDSEIPVGTPLAEVVIREATLAELGESMEIASERFRTSPLGPGESRTFQAVIVQPPDTASRFVLQIVEPGAHE